MIVFFLIFKTLTFEVNCCPFRIYVTFAESFEVQMKRNISGSWVLALTPLGTMPKFDKRHPTSRWNRVIVVVWETFIWLKRFGITKPFKY